MLSKNWTLQIQRNASTDELYFVTLTVVDWIDVFTRRYYNDFITRQFERPA